MLIETKYNIGDEIWFLGTEVIICDFIVNIKVEVDNEKNQTIIYELWNGGVCNEDELFDTKEDLLCYYKKHGGYDKLISEMV